jgi:hypothetical protein
MLCVQFLSSWWWAEKPAETCRALTVIKNIVKRFILLVVLKRICLRRMVITVNTILGQCLYRSQGLNENLLGFQNLTCVTNVSVARENNFTCCVVRIDLKLGLSLLTKETLCRWILQIFEMTLCTARFNFHQFYVLSTQCVNVFCIDLRTTAIISAYSINWLVL